MFGKWGSSRFLLDVLHLLPDGHARDWSERPEEFFRRGFALIDQLPGKPWAKTPDMKERFGVDW